MMVLHRGLRGGGRFRKRFPVNRKRVRVLRERRFRSHRAYRTIGAECGGGLLDTASCKNEPDEKEGDSLFHFKPRDKYFFED